MKPRHQVSRAAVDLIKRFEGYRMKAAQLPDGRWTIGYGHTLTARGGATVSEKDAEALLLYDLISVAHAVNEQTYAPLNQNQFDALVCFAFNIGLDNFVRSGVLRRINEGSLLQAACAMEMWRKADFEGERIVIDALVRRRSAEKALFLTPADGVWIASPSPILRPKVDYDASCAVPKQTPAAVMARFEGDRAVVEREDAAPLTLAIPDEDAPTASEQAAAAVGARLEAILPDVPTKPVSAPAAEPVHRDDLGLPELPIPAAAPPVAVFYEEPEAPAASTPFNLTSESVFRPEPAPVAEVPTFTPPPIAAAEPTLFETATRTSPSVFNLDGFSTSEDVALSALDVPFSEPETPRFGNLSLLLSLGVLGLAMFSGGVLWILTVASGPGFSQIKMFGYGASMVGAICFVVSAYLLLRKLAGPDVGDDD
ncbi:MAG: glycoside hydrolase family protein [Alphaproteobacteria bacterium]|nr:glycoside hydrolase family protein [Alphaproteobacteria bacterium]